MHHITLACCSAHHTSIHTAQIHTWHYVLQYWWKSWYNRPQCQTIATLFHPKQSLTLHACMRIASPLKGIEFALLNITSPRSVSCLEMVWFMMAFFIQLYRDLINFPLGYFPSAQCTKQSSIFDPLDGHECNDECFPYRSKGRTVWDTHCYLLIQLWLKRSENMSCSGSNL